MTFKGICDDMVKWGAAKGLPVYFGDEYTRNRLANSITGYFIFFDTPDGVQDYNELTTDSLTLRLRIQVLGTTAYERDDMTELQVLDDTFTVIADLAHLVGCTYTAIAAPITKLQNVYDSPKSGWQIDINISE